MGIPWPTSFPDLFEIAGAAFEPVSNAMAMEVESGAPMTRLRFTGEMDDFSGRLPAVPREQAIEIVEFWRYDLRNGVLPFTWEHPLTLEAADFLFLAPDGKPAPPRFTPEPGGYWVPNFQLRRLP